MWRMDLWEGTGISGSGDVEEGKGADVGVREVNKKADIASLVKSEMDTDGISPEFFDFVFRMRIGHGISSNPRAGSGSVVVTSSNTLHRF